MGKWVGYPHPVVTESVRKLVKENGLQAELSGRKAMEGRKEVAVA
jgi:hypothetical protein